MTVAPFTASVKDTTTSGGAGAITVSGSPPTGFQGFDARGNGAAWIYFIRGRAGTADEGAWECRYGIATVSGTISLSNGAVLESSNGGAAVNWTGGVTKDVFCVPASAVINAILGGNSGTSRLAWLQQYGLWVDTSGAPTVVLKMFDGTDDITLGSVNTSTNVFIPSVPIGNGLSLSGGNIIADLANTMAVTSPQTGDFVAIVDISASNETRTITIANLLKVLNLLTEDTSPDKANDFLLIYDTSAAVVKKAKPSNIAATPQYLLYKLLTANNVSGPTYTGGAWRAVSLTDEISDTGGDGVLSSGNVTLQAGTYEFEADVSFTGDGSYARARLYNISDSAEIGQGMNDQGSFTGGTNGHARVKGRFVLASAKQVQLQIYPKVNTAALTPVNSGDSECWAWLELKKVA